MLLVVDNRAKGELWTDEDVGVLVEELRERRGKLGLESVNNGNPDQIAKTILETSREILLTIHRISKDEVHILIAEFNQASASIQEILGNDQPEAAHLRARAQMLEKCIADL